jgi:hypothetical protein
VEFDLCHRDYGIRAAAMMPGTALPICLVTWKTVRLHPSVTRRTPF